MNVSIEEWEPKENLVLESSALEALKDSGNSLVLAGPGAGKTELLAQKASFLLETNSCQYPKEILAISFKKDAAVNLKERITQRLPKKMKKRFVSRTFDSFAKNLLDRFLNALPTEFRPNKNYIIITNDKKIKYFLKKNGFSIHRNSIKHLTSNKFEELGSKHINMWKSLIKGDSEGDSFLTFPMITRLAIRILNANPYILEALRKTYSHVFIDEFQDTTNLQYDLITTCFFNSDVSITAVGDKRQRIMLWAGAKANIFYAFKNDFNASIYELLMNHRSAPRLLEIQKSINNYLQDKPFTPTPNSKWDSNQGQAEIWYSQNSINEVSNIAKEIQYLIKENKLSYNDICIIVRQKSYKFGEEIIPIFEKYGIKARDESKFQDLLKEEIILLVINTFKSALEVRNSDAWLYIWDTLIHLENDSVIDSLRNELKDILKTVRDCLNRINSKEKLNVLVNKILKFYNLGKIKNNFPQYAQENYVERLIENMVDYLFDYYSSAEDWLDAIDSFEGKNSVPIMTIHKSKGLEFEAVFFVGLDDTNFWNFKNSKKEETYGFFVGLSRAKQFLYFTFSMNRFGTKHTINDISILYEMLEKSGVVDKRLIGFD